MNFERYDLGFSLGCGKKPVKKYLGSGFDNFDKSEGDRKISVSSLGIKKCRGRAKSEFQDTQHKLN